MKKLPQSCRRGIAATLTITSLVLPSIAEDQIRSSAPAPLNRASIDKMIERWPARPKLGAEMMISQYGVPHEATAEKLVWNDQGPFKRITVSRKEDHHDFPKPHMDYIEHTVNYQVPLDKVDALSAFDGSATFDRTRGELSGRCDLEGHNILTLNLSHDIATGKKNANQARKAFGEIVGEDMMGKNPPYATSLQFKPMAKMAAAFSDQPTIPGSPMRPDAHGQMKNIKGSAGDGEILGFLGAINENEIVAAMVVSKKKVNPQVAEYAKMLHQAHGKNLDQTLKVGLKIDVTPLETQAVDALRVKGAGELATLVPLDGEEFSRAYIVAMIKGHTEVLEMIDSQLLPKAGNDMLKKHLTETREHVASHLEAVKKLQGNGAVASSLTKPNTRIAAGQEQDKRFKPAPIRK